MTTADTAATFEQNHSCARHLGVQDAGTVVLVVSAIPEDRQVLADMLTSHSCPRYWRSNVHEAANWLSVNQARVVICDRSLPDGTWRDLWERLRDGPDPPKFIVTADWTDDRLWAEVLNLGAYDVLVKPYQKGEVGRILEHICGRPEYLT